MQLSEVMVKAGLIDEAKLSELQRWGAPVPSPQETSPDCPSPRFGYPEELVRALEQAMDDQGLVVVRETDLEAVPQYLATMNTALLHVEIDGESADFDIMVGMLRTGEYLLPWRADVITDVLTNGSTYLFVGGEKKVYFSSARELFYGESKAFVACLPASHE